MPRRQQTTYIVHMNHNLKPSSFPTHQYHWYSATLNSLTTTSSDSDSDSDSLLLNSLTTTSSDVVRGKLVLCDRGINARVEKGLVVRDAGGVGMILANTAASGEELVADSHLLPAVAVGRKVGDLIRDYVRKDGATAVLSFDGKVLNVRPPAVVAAFSSRGPNMVTQQVLKPDVIGPGVKILAGWSEAVGPTGLDQDTRKIQFNFKSGVWIEGATGRQWDLICGLGEQESSLNTPFRSGIDPTVAIFASAALPVKRPSEWSENRIEVPNCSGPAADARPLAIANLNATVRGPRRGLRRASKQRGRASFQNS